MKNILVFFGGKSSERDVSVITGVLAVNGTDKDKYNAIPVYIDKTGKWYTGDALKDVENYKKLDYKKLKRVTLVGGDDSLYVIKKNKLVKACEIALAVNCLHGLFGEDGMLAGVLSSSGIPLASPDLSGSAVGMDKGIAKDVAKSHNVRALPYISVAARDFFSKRRQTIEKIKKTFGYPVIVKPTRLGSSIGIGVAKTDDELTDALFTALRYDTTCVIERKLTGFTEVSTACYRYRGKLVTSKPEINKTQNEILSFNDKYGGGGEKIADGVKDAKILKTLDRYTKKLYDALKLNGVVRVDYLIEKDKVYFNEINTVPGSLAYYFYCRDTLEIPKFLNKLYEEAFVKSNEENNLTYDYESDVLELDGIKGGKVRT